MNVGHSERSEEPPHFAFAIAFALPVVIPAELALSEVERGICCSRTLGWCQIKANPMTLYIATSNPGKLRDFAAAATPNIALIPLPKLAFITPPAEDQPTFEGNARLKALYYSNHAPGEIVIADDSGLEVDALHGRPGVRSARFADDHNFHPPESNSPLATDQRNNLYLLHLLIDIPLTERSARYHCVLAAARNGDILAIGHGAVEGEILTTPRGTHGFGYDPLFYLPNENKTMAELDIKTKLAFSHRGRAFAALLKALLPPLQPTQIQ
jgi:XTP/dITP diphosphohydrolase